MVGVWRGVVAGLICALVLSGFLVGVSQYPRAAYGPFLGVTAGLFSAFCWGCTGISFSRWSIAEVEGTSGILNIAAAVLAAAAVGYLAPQDACTTGPDALLRAFICGFYRNVSITGLAAAPAAH